MTFQLSKDNHIIGTLEQKNDLRLTYLSWIFLLMIYFGET